MIDLRSWLQLGIMGGVFTNVIITAYFYGRLVQTIRNHGRRIAELEECHPRKEKH
jgi:hypothetical protein